MILKFPEKNTSAKLPPQQRKIRSETFWTQTKTVVFASITVTAVTMGIREAKVLQVLELNAYDQIVRFQSKKTPDSRLLIVGIDDLDLKKTNEWPISDGTLARALEKLQQYEPKVIGLDIHRDIPQPPGRQQLLAQLQADNLVLIEKGDRKDLANYIPPPPEIDVPDERLGFSDFVVDSDNIIRRNLLRVESQEQIYHSFALQISLKYLNGQEKYPVKAYKDRLEIGSTIWPRLQPNAGSYQMNESDMLGWQTMLTYHSQDNLAEQVSLTDVLEGNLKPSQVKDKVVMIGYTAAAAKDLFATLYSVTTPGNELQEMIPGESFLMPGVVLHAQMVSQILNTVLDGQKQIWVLPVWGEWAWIFVWSLVGGILVIKVNHPLYFLGMGTIAVGIIWGIAYLFFLQSGWISVIPPIISFLGTGIAILGYRFFWGLYHDPLTGLPNRRLFVMTLQTFNHKQRQQKRLIAVFFLNLDRFKIVNEGLGHKVGDYLLANTAKRLHKQLQNRGQIARVGGDEFAIWLKSIENQQAAINIAEEMQEALNSPLSWQGQDIYTSASIGIALNCTGDNFYAENILRDAHIAMYGAKKSGKVEVYNTVSKGLKPIEMLQLESELRQAIIKKELELYYQPIISLKTGKIAGFEALIRWNSPTRGLVSPYQFIPLAEETGLIIPMGQWIFQEACQQIQEWHCRFPDYSPLIMSVNLSGRQFSHPDLILQIQKIVEDLKLEKNSVKLEITESMMMNNIDTAIDVLQDLKKLGLKLSIDDFGTGYSSLDYLHRFPVDTLKVDRSFVNGIKFNKVSDKYTQIVRTIIMLGHNFELDIIAEGVETREQMEILRNLDCEYGQGYLFSKPIPKKQITELLATNPQW